MATKRKKITCDHIIDEKMDYCYICYMEEVELEIREFNHFERVKNLAKSILDK